MHYCNGLHVECFRALCLTLHTAVYIQCCFHPFSPLSTRSHAYTKVCPVYAARHTVPHVVRQTEIAAPSPAVLINPRLSEAALLRLGAVITSLHLLRPQPPLQHLNTFPKDGRVASAAFQVVKLGSSFNSASI